MAITVTTGLALNLQRLISSTLIQSWIQESMKDSITVKENIIVRNLQKNDIPKNIVLMFYGFQFQRRLSCKYNGVRNTQCRKPSVMYWLTE